MRAAAAADSSSELLVGLSRRSGEPLGHQLQRHLREAIRSGRLRAGERLPPSRVLADQLGVSRGVVVSCYEQLQSEGYLQARVGVGSVVANGVRRDAGEASGPVGPVARVDVSFEYGIPDLESFPRRAWAWAMAEACRTASTADLGDETGGGCEALRDGLAAYGRRVRAAVATPEAVVVVPGFRHGLNVVMSALARRGVKAVGLEDPGPRDHDRIARRWGLTPVGIPVDEDGLVVDQLSRAEVGAVITTPAHQCPTGVVLAAGRRHALVEWARDVDGYVIEDDFDAELRYDRQPVGSLQGLAPDRVIAMGSVSKTLAPTIRLGWMIVPEDLRDDVLDAKALSGRGAPGLDQLALAALLSSSRFERHLRKMRQVYGRRRQLIAHLVDQWIPGSRILGSSAGCHLVVVLPPGSNEDDVSARCATRGVEVAAMSCYRLGPPPVGAQPALVVGFGNVTEPAIERGLRVLAEVVAG